MRDHLAPGADGALSGEELEVVDAEEARARHPRPVSCARRVHPEWKRARVLAF